MERTLIIIKPDALKRGLAGEITSRFEKKGLKLVGMKMMKLNDVLLKKHYAHLADKPFFGRLVKFMKSSPSIIQCWEGVEAVETARLLSGVTNSRKAAPGTIRGDLSMSMQCNTVHASDSATKANKEIEMFFDKNEVFGYDKNDNFYYSEEERE